MLFNWNIYESFSYDIVVLDISATTIDQDESSVKNIPSSESDGRMIMNR